MEFRCEHCGKCIQCDESSPGKPADCPVCKVAMSSPPEQTVTTVSAPKVGTFRKGLSWATDAFCFWFHIDASQTMKRLTPVLIVVAIIATTAGLLFPAIYKVIQAKERTESTNNLKRTGLAFLSFHNAN